MYSCKNFFFNNIIVFLETKFLTTNLANSVLIVEVYIRNKKLVKVLTLSFIY